MACAQVGPMRSAQACKHMGNGLMNYERFHAEVEIFQQNFACLPKIYAAVLCKAFFFTLLQVFNEKQRCVLLEIRHTLNKS